MNILSDYPYWYFILCIGAGIIYSGLLYWKDRRNEFPLLSRWIMASARFLVVTLAAFFLLSPLVKSIRVSKEKPIIIMALDNSSSLANDPGSGLDTTSLLQQWNELSNDLSGDYEVKPFLFGDQVREGTTASFSDKYTDASVLLDEMETRFTNRNVGAMIFATDGMFNRGRNPAYMVDILGFPVYPVALGDTTRQKDIKISKLYYNKITYLGNEFPVEVVLQANGYEGEVARLQIRSEGELVREERISINSASFSKTLSLGLVSEDPGTREYRISVQPFEGETNTENNSRLAFIEVLDARQKILILANAPHPDITAIRQAIESNRNYAVEVKMSSERIASFGGYNLVILHDLPSPVLPPKRLENMLGQGATPYWLIAGQNTDVRYLESLNSGIIFDNIKRGGNDATAYFNEGFGLFTIPGSLEGNLEDYPPLKAPFADYRYKSSVSVLFSQKIGKVESGYPMLAFNQDGPIKVGILLGEGIWRWRLHNFMARGNHEDFNTLVNKVVQYLSVRADKRRFRVEARYEYPENEDIVIDAELYNETFELINDPDARIVIKDDTGRSYPYNFSRKGNSYTLNLGVLRPGRYGFTAGTQLGGAAYEDEGMFTVSPVMVEMMSMRADHNVLFRMASGTGGRVYYPADLDMIAEDLKESESIKTIVYEKKMFNELINLKWIFFILLALLSVEWFLRRWLGSY